MRIFLGLCSPPFLVHAPPLIFFPFATGDAINKKYWTEGREELRRQVGYMRFDLNTLAASKGGASAKGSALAAKKDLFETIDKLDFAMRMKDQATAAKVFADVTAKATAIAGSF